MKKIRHHILEWFDAHARVLPWRHKGGAHPDPYHVWLSEIMLQQTTVTAVKPYFETFIKTWSSVFDLANSPRDDVTDAWAGLGYYSRARNLHKCAQVIANDYNGVFPDDIKTLKTLPGIGDYTAAAMRAIAFNKPAVVIDGNIDRILARVYGIETPFPEAKKEIKQRAVDFYGTGVSLCHSDLAQALMDIGATICTPKQPKCMLCPMQSGCTAYKTQKTDIIPLKTKKKAVPHKYGTADIIINQNNEILCEQRPDTGLLAGMRGLPTSDWRVENKGQNKTNLTVHHVFTHFKLTLYLHIHHTNAPIKIKENQYFTPIDTLDIETFPTIFQKCLHFAFDKHDKTA